MEKVSKTNDKKKVKKNRILNKILEISSNKL